MRASLVVLPTDDTIIWGGLMTSFSTIATIPDDQSLVAMDDAHITYRCDNKNSLQSLQGMLASMVQMSEHQ